MTAHEHRIIPLFATPLFETTVDVAEHTKEYIKNIEYTRFPANNGYGTPDKFLLDKPELAELKNNIMMVCKNYIYNILEVNPSADFQMTNSWAVKHLKGDESGSHDHANSMLSGVLYIQTDDQSGDILFYKNKAHYNLFTPTVDITFKNQNMFNTAGWAIRPKNNMLILFPSTLDHSVFPSESDQQRYAVAFNLFAFGKFGYDQVTQLHINNGSIPEKK
jgi:uncharacterized protein (TIGR02466 family)